jgi:hypothetical protein
VEGLLSKRKLAAQLAHCEVGDISIHLAPGFPTTTKHKSQDWRKQGI